MNKRLLAATVCLCVIMNMTCIPTVAAVFDGGISPIWVNAISFNANITRSGSTVSWSSSVTALPGTTRIAATYTLYRQNTNGGYSYVDSWSDNGTNTFFASSGSAAGSAGTYKLVYSISITTNGKVEKIEDELVKTV